MKRKYTFYMHGFWGDDFYATVKASSIQKARRLLELIYDDARVGRLM